MPFQVPDRMDQQLFSLHQLLGTGTFYLRPSRYQERGDTGKVKEFRLSGSSKEHKKSSKPYCAHYEEVTYHLYPLTLMDDLGFGKSGEQKRFIAGTAERCGPSSSDGLKVLGDLKAKCKVAVLEEAAAMSRKYPGHRC